MPLGILSIALVLLLNLLASAPSLHEWFHTDAGETGHQCAVTMFTHGQVDSVTVAVPISAPSVLVVAESPPVLSLFQLVVENLPAGRAPPVAVSSPV